MHWPSGQRVPVWPWHQTGKSIKVKHTWMITRNANPCPRIMNYMVAQITPPGIANLGYRFWVIWAVICAAFVPITYLFYPETANRSLEDIDRFFADHPEIFVFRNKTATQ